MNRSKYNMKLTILAIFLFFTAYFMFYDTVAAIRLETGLPNIPGGRLTPGQELPSYIRYLFIFGLGLIAFLALAQMMIGGLTYILAAGNVAKIEDAKDTIKQALLGMGLLLVSYLLLRTINPDLVNLKSPSLGQIKFQGGAPPPPGLTGDNAKVGDPCSPNGSVSMPGFLLCENGKWTLPTTPMSF